MKTTYRVMSNAFFDRTGIVAKLEKLALKGWRLESIGGMFWKFRRIPAQKLRYAVTYFPEVSAFDPALPEKRSEFLDFCQAAGWQLCGSNGQLQVFVNEDPEAVDLETEPGPGAVLKISCWPQRRREWAAPCGSRWGRKDPPWQNSWAPRRAGCCPVTSAWAGPPRKINVPSRCLPSCRTSCTKGPGDRKGRSRYGSGLL